MIGRKISHYRVLERLGGGGMGEVFKAEDLRLDRRVALKFLPPELGEDPVAKERFMQEAKAASALNHENICTIHDIDETEEGRLFIAMAFYEGRTLKERLAAGPLPVEEALEIAEKIAEGLVKAHGKGIVHRDIKPANLMITRDGVVKIVDFGLAKLAEGPGLTKTGTSVGTPAYMSPEQAKGEEVDHRTDLWSLGVVLWEMLVGRRPFRGKSDGEILHAILYEDPRELASSQPGIPSTIQRLLDRLLAREAGERCSTARQALRLIQKAKEETGAPTGRTETGATTETPTLAWPGGVKTAGENGPDRSRSHRRSALIGGLALLAIFAILGGWWWWLGGAGEEKTTDARPEAALTKEVPAEKARSEQTLTGEIVPTSLTPEREMIVVLPFENLGPPEHDYFAEGVTEEIISRLAGIGELGVISRNTAVHYDAAGKGMQEIGRDLGVDYVLEGTVRWASAEEGPDRVRITPQLVRTADDTHVWADSYNAILEDIFAVQSDIAREVADALDAELTAEERSRAARQPTEDMRAYDYYSRARHEFYDYTREGNARALELFRKALEIDPEYALAWTGVSLCQAQYINQGWEPTEEHLTAAEEAARRALELEPDLAEAHFALAFVHQRTGAVGPCKREIETVLALNPNHAHAHDSLADILLKYEGRLDAAISEFRVALRLDPLLIPAIQNLVMAYRMQGRYEEALSTAERGMELGETLPRIWEELGQVQLALGRTERAAASFRKALELRSRRASRATDGLAESLIELGRFGQAEKLVSELARRSDLAPKRKERTTHFLRGKIALGKGNAEEAIERFRSALDVEAAEELVSGWGETLRRGRIQADLGEAYLAVGRPDRAVEAFEAALDAVPSEKLYHYWLGSALEEAGRTGAAVREYETFLDGWKRADPGVWPLEETRERLQGLR